MGCLRDLGGGALEAPLARLGQRAKHRAPCHVAVRFAEEAHAPRNGAQPGADAGSARAVRPLLLERGGTALYARSLACIAAPLLGVEREPAWVELRHARPAPGACARRREHLLASLRFWAGGPLPDANRTVA